MTYERFEDIPVWQTAIDLAQGVFHLTADRAFAGQGDIANQLQRAALSVSNNVAEGFERGSTNDLIAFLYYARGSAGEVRSILCLLERLPRCPSCLLRVPLPTTRGKCLYCERAGGVLGSRVAPWPLPHADVLDVDGEGGLVG